MRARLIQHLVHLAVALALCLGASVVHAQPLGVFRWQTQPYCNVVTFAVVQQGSIYTLTGTDDLCGAPQAAPANGTAALNPDGSISLGFSAVTPAGVAAHIHANIALAGFSGTWRDADGYSGVFQFNGSAAGSPRPAPVSPATAGALAGPGLAIPEMLVPQTAFNPIAETITTTVPGQLQVTKFVSATINCASGFRLYYLTVNGFPLRSSVVFISGTWIGQITGTTDAIIQPGAHVIGVSAQCAVSTAYFGSNVVLATSSSVVVIP
ncbi:MAG: hypothetical protein R2712_24665 [Vicinamibacterales bacterium]